MERPVLCPPAPSDRSSIAAPMESQRTGEPGKPTLQRADTEQRRGRVGNRSVGRRWRSAVSKGMLLVRRGKEGKAGPQGRSLPKINYSPRKNASLSSSRESHG